MLVYLHQGAEEPRCVCSWALHFLSDAQRAGLIYEVPTSLHGRALCLDAAWSIRINSPELDRKAVPPLGGGYTDQVVPFFLRSY